VGGVQAGRQADEAQQVGVEGPGAEAQFAVGLVGVVPDCGAGELVVDVRYPDDKTGVEGDQLRVVDQLRRVDSTKK